MKTLTIRRPDDWHLHLRDGAMLEAVLPGKSPNRSKMVSPVPPAK